MISVKDVSYGYPLPGGGERSALQRVSLEVHEGDILVILGANGAGKTTLGHLLAGVLSPDGGEIDRGRPPSAGEGRSGLSVGLVSQNPEDTFTSPVVREEMGTVLENLGWEESEVDCAVEGMLSEVGLASHADYPPSLLSGGQKQLLAIASILIAEPAWLVLDEPLSLLDSLGRAEVASLVSRLAGRSARATVLLSSEVEDVSCGNRFAILHRGRVVQQGRRHELPLERERLEGWGLVPPDLTELSALLAASGVPLERRLWNPEELARVLCRSS